MANFYELFRGGRKDKDITESVELNERERMVWDKGHADALELLRRIAARKGFIAREVRLGPVDPDPGEREQMLEQADTAAGPFTDEEDEIYIRSFNNTCLGGYPPSDA